jgi:uncharacterized protein (UPF0332 family)
MDSEYKIYLQRAENELSLARMILKLSIEPNIQEEVFKVSSVSTYFSSVISNSYYSIFYAAKAYLLKKGIKTKVPEEHKKTFEEFKVFFDKGVLDVELLKIYESIMMKADTLLGIFKLEKSKRGRFTYKTISQANKEPAEESIKHATTFFKHIFNICES